MSKTKKPRSVGSPGNKGLTTWRGRRGITERSKVITFLNTSLGVDTAGLLKIWETNFTHLKENEGAVSAVIKSKNLYQAALKIAAGVKLKPIPWTRADKSGVPLKLKAFLPYLVGSTNSKRAALTILQLYKLEEVKPQYNLDSIVAPFDGKVNQTWLSAFDNALETAFPKAGLEQRIMNLTPGLHVSGSNGPNGPCIGTAFVDREAIRGTPIEDNIRTLATLTSNYRLMELLEQTTAPDKPIINKKGKCLNHSVIRIKYEPGGKARPFAICDWFTQSSLVSIHQYCMNWLNNEPCDGTKSHGEIAEVARKWTSVRFPMYSKDLTTATDRFPLSMQLRTLTAIFGNEIAEAWGKVISDRDFKGPQGENIRWSVGQPLGALSSWAVFAITHHMLIQAAAIYEGMKIPKFNSYLMIGDDITVIRNGPVAARYGLFLDDLGVRVSIDKSIEPDQLIDQNSSVCEIAKRVFVNGEEITPLPPDAIIAGFEPLGFRNLLESSLGRGYGFASSPYSVQSFSVFNREWSSTTFPIRNRLPVINGLRTLVAVRESFNEFMFEPQDIGGIHKHWFFWLTKPKENIEALSRTYVLDRVIRAEEDCTAILNLVFYSSLGIKTFASFNNPAGIELSKYLKTGKLPRGGDWQPGPLAVHQEVLRELISYVREQLQLARYKLEACTTILSSVDLFEYIGKLTRFLEPERLVLGRRAEDEKIRSKVFVSRMVSFVKKHIDDYEPNTRIPGIKETFGE